MRFPGGALSGLSHRFRSGTVSHRTSSLRSIPCFTRHMRSQPQQHEPGSGSGERPFPRSHSGLTPPFRQLTGPSQLSEYLDQYVVGQEYAKKVLSVAVFFHYQRVRRVLEEREREREREELYMHGPAEDPSGVSTAHVRPLRRPAELRQLPPLRAPLFDKSNVMLIGPTGTGKTHLVRTLARALGVPFAANDATSFTQAGYVGDDVDTCIQRLLTAANGDPIRASTGIVYIDEIDKIARKTGTDGSRDVGGEGVQEALLRMLEGSIVTVQSKGDPSLGKPEMQHHIDTTNVLFILSGAFVGLDNIIKARLAESRGSMGFSAKTFFTPTPVLNQSVENSDLVKYGFTPEFVSRIHNNAMLSPLTVSDLRRILTEINGSLVSQYQSQFGDIGVEIKFTSEALDEVCSKALERGGGARGLRGIMEKVLLDTLYDVPGSDIRYVLVTAAMIKGESPARCWRKDDNNTSSVSFLEAWVAEERQYWNKKERQERQE
ncbi:P-loop containing nucleoside triphosphate hydrolase protein [Mycena rosella]|uniref:P-loop containing nucleoside triphosphate hydrolase protein n=1 Tax=Mycena rosella TaxID=1033263 RepID=A0AAD7DD71_MYCRO|nr:P-loop containing nucleoside triphosphate hydrolase protein [Mycena rosella]